jgi:hypothetical protein
MTYIIKAVIVAAASVAALSTFTSATLAMGSDREPDTTNVFTSTPPYKPAAVDKNTITTLAVGATQTDFIGNQFFADQK